MESEIKTKNSKAASLSKRNDFHKQSSVVSDIRKFKRNLSKEEINDLKKEIDIDEHRISLESLCARYDTSLEIGLTESKALELLQKNGPNSLTPPKETPEIIKFLKQMTNGFALLLWIGSIFSFIAFLIQWSQDKETPYGNAIK